jgi:putative transposase
MPRKLRVHHPGGVYHVILRGNDRQPIFRDEPDHERLGALVGDGLSRYRCRVHAFCWMPNHLHMVVQVGERPLGALMRWLGSCYARSFNRRHGRTGHLFERRHRAHLVETDSYLIALVRYIHLNPIAAGLAASAACYRWSSHPAYLGLQAVPWLSTELVLGTLAADATAARRALAGLVDDGPGTEPTPPPPAPRSPPSAPADDGGPTSDGGTEERRVVPPEVSVAELLGRECRRAGLSPEAVRGPGKQRAHAAVRARVAMHALASGAATLAGLARFFGRSESAIFRIVERHGRTAGGCEAPRSRRGQRQQWQHRHPLCP